MADRGTQPEDRHIWPVRATYTGIFRRLLGVLADAVRIALSAPPMSVEQRQQEYRVRSAARRAHEAMGAMGIQAAQEAVKATAERGGHQAVVELRRLGHDPLSPIDSRATRLIQQELSGRLQAAHLAILREPEDIYRRIISQATLLAPGDDGSRRLHVAQHALNQFADHGITGFTDRAGRRWDITTYVEMATRTAASRAYTDAHTEWLTSNGVTLGYVTDVAGECSLCLVPGTVVEGPVPTARSRSHYTGDVVSIRTASGNDLTGTPDHPVLTLHGWRPLKGLRPGDKVVSHRREHDLSSVVPGDVQVPTAIEKAGEAVAPLLLAGPACCDLDSHVAYREVHAVRPDSNLLSVVDVPLVEPTGELSFIGGVGPAASLLGPHDGFLASLGDGDALGGCVCGVEHGSPLFGSGVGPALEHVGAVHGRSLLGSESGLPADDAAAPGARLGSCEAQVVSDGACTDPECGSQFLSGLPGFVAADEFGGLGVVELPHVGAAVDWLEPVFRKDGDEPRLADLEGGHELLRRLSGAVTADEVVDISVSEYSGHVWDLSTEPAWFIANGIVTHNCRPWEGDVVALDPRGLHEIVTVNRIDTPPDRVYVAHTLAEARAAGLLHPACRHRIQAFEDGATVVPHGQPDPEGEAARAHLRYLERGVRRWKLREAAALNETARKAARVKVRAWQAAIREHVTTAPVTRQSRREQIDRAR